MRFKNLQNMRKLSKPISTELKKNDSINETPSEKAINATRRSILQSIVSVGLASVFLQGCERGPEESEFRQNFDIDTVLALPENERGREYIGAPKLDLDDARNFLESVDESFFPIKLSKIVKVVEVQNQPAFSVDVAIVKSVVEDFLAKQKADSKLIELRATQSFLYLELQIGEKVYQLSMPVSNQISVESTGAESRSLMLNEFRAARFSSHPNKTPAGGVDAMVESIYFGDKQSLRNVNDNLHSEFKDNAIDAFDLASLSELMKWNQNPLLYGVKESLFPRKLLEGIDLATWIDLIKQLPKDSPEAYVAFYSNFVKYSKLDREKADEYRHPIDSLKSGWGDCDDFVMLNALWGKLNGYKGKVVSVFSKKYSRYHVLIEINNGRDCYVMDVDQVIVNKTAEQYVAERSDYDMIDSEFDTF